MTLGKIDTILFALLIVVMVIQLYWTWQDRKAGIKGS